MAMERTPSPLASGETMWSPWGSTMPRYVAEEEDWGDDDWDEEEGPWDHDEQPVVPCPYCGEEIAEDSQLCPHCKSFISEEDAPPDRKPWWIIVGVLLCFYVIYHWISG
jgi:hypothetical protein